MDDIDDDFLNIDFCIDNLFSDDGCHGDSGDESSSTEESRSSDTTSTDETSDGDDTFVCQKTFVVCGAPKRVRFRQPVSETVLNKMQQTLINIGATDGKLVDGVLLGDVSVDTDVLDTIFKFLPFEFIAKYYMLKWCVQFKGVALDTWNSIQKQFCNRDGKLESDKTLTEKKHYITTNASKRIVFKSTKPVADACHDSMLEFDVVSTTYRGTKGLVSFGFPCDGIVSDARRRVFFLLSEKARFQFCYQQMFGMMSLDTPLDKLLPFDTWNVTDDVKIIVKEEEVQYVTKKRKLSADAYVKTTESATISRAAGAMDTPVTNVTRLRLEYTVALTKIKEEWTCGTPHNEKNESDDHVDDLEETACESCTPPPKIDSTKKTPTSPIQPMNVTPCRYAMIWGAVTIYSILVVAFVAFFLRRVEPYVLIPIWDDTWMTPIVFSIPLVLLTWKLAPSTKDILLVLLTLLLRIQFERRLEWECKRAMRLFYLFASIQMLLCPWVGAKSTYAMTLLIFALSFLVPLHFSVRIMYLVVFVAYNVKRLNHCQGVGTILLSPFRDVVSLIMMIVMAITEVLKQIA